MKMYKETLIGMCKLVNKHVKKRTKSIVPYSEKDMDEIRVKWDEDRCRTITERIRSNLVGSNTVYDTQLHPWCLRFDIDASVPMERFFSCRCCLYGSRHKMCNYSRKDTYTRIKKKLHCTIAEIPGLLRAINRYLKKELE